MALAPFAIALAVYLTAYLVMQPKAIGDEPHYLVAAQSIALDGDIDLRNDYASRERTLRVANEFPLEPPHAARYAGSDELLPWHGIGLSLILAPAAGLGGETPARLFLILLTAFLAYQLFQLLAESGVARPRYRWLAWVAVALCLPLVTFSSQIYPEVPGALLVASALRVILQRNPPSRAILVGGLSAAALPWLHVRYLPLAGAIVVGLLYAAVRERIDDSEPLGRRVKTVGQRTVELFRSSHRNGASGWAACAPLALSLGIMAAAFQAWYGSPLPTTPYRTFFQGTVGSAGWTFWYDYLLPDILHPAYGWIPYAPVHWLGLAGLGYLIWRFRWEAVAILAAAFAYVALVASTALPLGFQFPGRIVLVVACLIIVPLALVVDRFRIVRILFVPLLLLSLAFAVAGVLRYESLYPESGYQSDARLPGVRSIRTAFPYSQPRLERLLVQPGEVAPLAGRVEGSSVVASAASGEQPGYVIWGSYHSLDPAVYRADFSLGAESASEQRAVATIEIVLPGSVPLAQRQISAPEIAGQVKPIPLAFAVPDRTPVEPRVLFEGNGTLTAGTVEILRVTGIERFPDWPTVFVWVAGTALVGALLVQFGRRSGLT